MDLTATEILGGFTKSDSEKDDQRNCETLRFQMEDTSTNQDQFSMQESLLYWISCE